MIDDYARSIATGENFYLDVNSAGDKDNFGFLHRLNATRDDKEVSCIIHFNRYSFFKGLETNMLSSSQIQISATLTDDNVLKLMQLKMLE